jgi:hypothetical protein
MVTSRIHTVGRRRDSSTIIATLEAQVGGRDSGTMMATLEVVCVNTLIWIGGVVAESFGAGQVVVAWAIGCGKLISVAMCRGSREALQ